MTYQAQKDVNEELTDVIAAMKALGVTEEDIVTSHISVYPSYRYDEKTEGFTVMSNSHLKDRSISLKAKGLLSLILSLPDGWVYTIKGLATLNSDGLDSTRAALKNLEDHGYVVRRQLYDKRGRFAKCEYTVYERCV